MADLKTAMARGPLDHMTFDEHRYEGVILRALPWCPKINVRVDPSDGPTIATAVRDATGIDLPVIPNTVTSGVDSLLIWLGPNEWQWRVTSVSNEAVSLVDHLQRALGSVHCAVVDVSDYYTLLELEGRHAVQILRKGSPLDVDTALINASRCAQTRYGNAAVLLTRSDGVDRYQLQVRWSFADYLCRYLVDAAYEFSIE